MKKLRMKFLLAFILGIQLVQAQGSPQEIAKARDQKAVDEAKNGWWKEDMKNHDARIQWWRDARFGMFVHWGIYALPANEWNGKILGGYSEHLMRREKITKANYLDIAKQFNPVKFDADKWIKDAKNAGMRYFVITAKHHDGFAMFPSAVSDFTLEKQTPFKRDPMAELAAACKKYGVKFGFYYSHAFDWEHPDAPGNDWEYKNPGGDLDLYGGRKWYNENPQMVAKAAKYVDEKAIPQIYELIEKYHPDIIWFDTPHKLPYSENLRILKAVWDKDKNIVVNARITDSSPYGEWGDYKGTDDQPAEFFAYSGDWEAIPTTNDSFGYSRADKSHKPASFFIQLMAKAASRGGNLLMNIGPKADGTFDDKDEEILSGIGEWMNKNGGSIYKSQKSVLPLQSFGVSTTNGNLLYLHVFNWPKDGNLYVGGLESKVKRAYLLSDTSKKELKINRLNSKDISIKLQKVAPDPVNTVVVLEIDGEVKTDKVRYVAANSPTQMLAFDAELKGTGLIRANGKKDVYYVYHWTNKDQALIWNFRTNEPSKFNISIDYITDVETGGKFSFEIDSQITEHEVVLGTDKKGKRIHAELTTTALKSGLHTIKIVPLDITGKELMKILEINLVPLNK